MYRVRSSKSSWKCVRSIRDFNTCATLNLSHDSIFHELSEVSLNKISLLFQLLYVSWPVSQLHLKLSQEMSPFHKGCYLCPKAWVLRCGSHGALSPLSSAVTGTLSLGLLSLTLLVSPSLLPTSDWFCLREWKGCSGPNAPADKDHKLCLHHQRQLPCEHWSRQEPEKTQPWQKPGAPGIVLLAWFCDWFFQDSFLSSWLRNTGQNTEKSLQF